MNLREIIRTALDNAKIGGYDQSKMDPLDVAIELADYESEISSMVEEFDDAGVAILQKEMIDHITQWQKEQGVIND